MARRSTGSGSEKASYCSRTNFSEDHVLLQRVSFGAQFNSLTSYNELEGHDVSAVDLYYGNARRSW